ncbi:hypothetical protein PspLS_05708 [Pyricularia sp. CBS 133598]|nr:hypothetical protein PspLS_05708 [Pyricularia sp. CBS 133598]
MSSGTLKAVPQPKPGQGHPVGGPSSQAILLEKLNRRATPDSEALASSDDDGDHRQDQNQPLIQPHKPVRRASWLNDTSQAAIRPRKDSFASSTMSPTTSHPSTPSVETGAATWGNLPGQTASLSRAHTAGGSTFPWGTAIWGSERKELPSRLAEHIPSPTTAFPPGTTGSPFGNPEHGLAQTSPGPREPVANSQIPFAIPLHPTPKTYRSQSYSVGQLDPDTPTNPMMPSSTMGSRTRQLPHPGLQHRPSRPSMLSEMSNDGMLGKVKEVDDDDESSESMSGSQQQQQSAESKTIEFLTRENAMLRQQQQYHNSRLRPRASTGYGLGGNGYGLQASVPEESDYAIDELEEGQDSEFARRAYGRRMSEFGVPGGTSQFRSPFSAENRKIETMKKAYWHSALGFGGIGDQPQSRRHSFADVPQRQASISSLGEHLGQDVLSQEPQSGIDFTSPYAENSAYQTASTTTYFTGGSGLQMAQQAMGPSAQYPSPYPYAMNAAISHRPTSPHRAMYGVSQPNRLTPLHVVLFKCARADVFYIQEGTGLTVKAGDLVIVEADRGTDLGTVAAENVDWNEAKRLKEHYAEEQYKWLMMYSQNAGVAQDGVGAGLMAASNGGSAIGGMGPPSQHHMQEAPSSGELKPKLIKRLAQAHEIQNLRDKEGNEAKAKRVCMQKVKEHGLNMEILDAEFQVDWKKLTFYYFADSYINFNSLVTDLFKIYKTRIWMSAINPASFATPLGLQAPSGVGPGAVGLGRGGGVTGSDRRQHAQSEPVQSARSFQQQAATFTQPFSTERVAPPTATTFTPPTYFPSYAGFPGSGRAPGSMPYGNTAMVPSADAYTAAGFSQGGIDYRTRMATAQSSGPGPHDEALSPLSVPADIAGPFQSLSLNSR